MIEAIFGSMDSELYTTIMQQRGLVTRAQWTNLPCISIELEGGVRLNRSSEKNRNGVDEKTGRGSKPMQPSRLSSSQKQNDRRYSDPHSHRENRV